MTQELTEQLSGGDNPRLPQALCERIDIMPVVESLRPLIEASLESIEVNRRLPQQLVDAMFDAGIPLTQHPREFGGLELHPLDYLDLVFELSRISGAVGWIAVIQNGALPLMSVDVMRELIDKVDGRWLVSGSHGRVGTAVKVDGGYRFSGEWAFASGAPWASYITAYAKVVDENGEPIMDPMMGTQAIVDGVFPKDAVDYLDRWHPMGMRGTGSGQFKLDDVFLEERFVQTGMPTEDYSDRALFRNYWVTDVGACFLGMAQASLDAYGDLRDRRETGGTSQIEQIEVSELDAAIRSAKHWLWDVTARSFARSPLSGERAGYELGMLGTQATLHSARVAKDVVGAVFELGGADSMMVGNKIESCFRDVNTATQHIATVRDNHRPIGEFILTRDHPDGGHVGENAFFPPPPPPAHVWAVDPMHSSVRFRVTHHAVGSYWAEFSDFSARYNPVAGTFSGSVSAKSLDTFDMVRDHLLGEDFLDAENRPEITFRSSSVQIDGDEVTVEGDLTLRGVTKPVTARGSVSGTSEVEGWGPGAPANEHIGMDLSLVIDRREFGIDFNNELLDGQLNLGWDVTLELSLELARMAGQPTSI